MKAWWWGVLVGAVASVIIGIGSGIGRRIIVQGVAMTTMPTHQTHQVQSSPQLQLNHQVNFQHQIQQGEKKYFFSLNFIELKGFNNKSISTILQTTTGNVLVGTAENGLFLSTDQGQNFTSVSFIPDIPDINTIFQTSNGNVLAGIAENGLFLSTDQGQTFTQVSSVPSTKITTIFQIGNGNVLVGTRQSSLYCSADQGQTFTQVSSVTSTGIFTIFQTTTGNVLVGTEDGIYKASCLFSLTTQTSQQPFYQAPNQPSQKQMLVSKGTLTLNVQSLPGGSTVTLDGNSLTLPSSEQITQKGKHDLTVMIGGDTYDYTIWIKTSINQDHVSYETKSDTEWYSGLVSNKGNTNGWRIEKTKVKSGSHQAGLTVNISDGDQIINWQQSFYQTGTIDTKTNYFKPTGGKIPLAKSGLNLTENGIYHLHVEDVVGNQYDAVLELGQVNWQTQGKFDDGAFQKKLQALKVTVDIKNPSQLTKQKISGWLGQDQSYVTATINTLFEQAVKQDGGGWDVSYYQAVLTKVQQTQKTYLESTVIKSVKTLPDYTTKLEQNKIKGIFDGLIGTSKTLRIDEQLAGVAQEAQTLHVTGQNNVVDKMTLSSYLKFIADYQSTLKKVVPVMVKQDIVEVGLGYLTPQQVIALKNQFNLLTVEQRYLQAVVWTPKLRTINAKDGSYDFAKNIKQQQLQQEIQSAVNNLDPNPKQQLADDIHKAEEGVKLYGIVSSKC